MAGGEKGNVIGFVMGNRQTSEMGVIAALEEYENQGVGKTLLRLIENWLESEGHIELWLTADPDETGRAVGFYRQLDWQDWKFEHGDRYMRKKIERAA